MNFVWPDLLGRKSACHSRSLHDANHRDDKGERQQMAEFASPVKAVRCATEIQLAIDRRNREFSQADPGGRVSPRF